MCISSSRVGLLRHPGPAEQLLSPVTSSAAAASMPLLQQPHGRRHRAPSAAATARSSAAAARSLRTLPYVAARRSTAACPQPLCATARGCRDRRAPRSLRATPPPQPSASRRRRSPWLPRTHNLAPLPRHHRIRAGGGRIWGLELPPPRRSPAPASGRTRRAKLRSGGSRAAAVLRDLQGFPRHSSGGGASGMAGGEGLAGG
ncbi:unnamed protein product [Urochloa humidicola]